MIEQGDSQFKYKKLQSNLGNYTPTTRDTTPSSPSSPSSPKGSGGSKSSSSDKDAERAKREAEKAAEEAKKKAEEEYKARLEKYKDFVDERERLEQRWVSKQKELGQLSNKDFLYITQQRINRYKAYLQEVKNATWMNAEDRKELEKKYTEEIEDLQLDYLGYLKDVLDDEIDLIEKNRDEKIKAVEDEADARINALKKVESENDRIRSKEDYEKKKGDIQEQIDYWSQRTGREAQENLLEAKKQMQELDEDWKQTLEDWSLDDQIQAIEDARDKEIEALEDAAQKEIDNLKKVYDYKVKLFSETGQIIFDNGVIESKNLYNAYKTNFVDPLKNDLAELRKSTATTSTSTTPNTSKTTTSNNKTQQYETYTIKYGETLSGIAQKFGTTVDKLMKANPYIKDKNKIYAGNKLQIPKFHEGGETTGFTEGYALLKPHEIILKPEWATGIKKLAKMADQNNFSASNSTVNIKGDLVKIEAQISNKADADYLTRKIEKVVSDKLNIRK